MMVSGGDHFAHEGYEKAILGQWNAVTGSPAEMNKVNENKIQLTTCRPSTLSLHLTSLLSLRHDTHALPVMFA